jgi:hypothetical protein
MRKTFLPFVLLLLFSRSFGQYSLKSSELKDSLSFLNQPETEIISKPLFSPIHFAVPVAMVAYGFIALKSDDLRELDENTQEEIWDDHPHKDRHIDNYLQFVPAVAVYALNFCGIQGEHDLLDRTAIFAMSNIFLNATVTSLKNVTHQLRPDSSDYKSFPSGHAAEAFANAEFLRLEYRNQSVWYGVGGYLVAAITGYLRMYNNKHYLSDVLAGAGIGILSTDASYWLYPKVKNLFVKHDIKNTMVLPFYSNKTLGLTFNYIIH